MRGNPEPIEWGCLKLNSTQISDQNLSIINWRQHFSNIQLIQILFNRNQNKWQYSLQLQIQTDNYIEFTYFMDVQPQQPNTLSRKTLQQQPSLNPKSSRLTSPKAIKNKASPEQKLNINHPYAHQPQIICSKQNQCQFQYRPKDSHLNDDTQFSIDSQLLKEEVPISIEIQPEIQLQVKPEIDQLIATNIRMNRYKQAYKKIQKEEEQRLKFQRLKKLTQSAKLALNGGKKIKNQTKNKWGHSIYGEQTKIAYKSTDKLPQQHFQIQQSIESPNTKKANLQNAAQLAQKRIQQYKEKQLLKQKQLQKKQTIYQKQNKLDPKKLEQVNTQIALNAAEILKQKQNQIQSIKKRKQSIKNKIQELRKESLNNCKKSKKKPVTIQQGKQEDLVMGDSQYSTFEARKEGRKMIKKGKKKKNQQESNDDSKIVAQTSSRRYLKEKMSKTTANFTKNKNKKGPVSEKQNTGSRQNQNQEQEGNKEFKKFYIWNVPIKQEDYSLVALQKKIQQEKGQTYQKKQQLSFKEQAEHYLRQKELIKFEEERQKTRQEYLEQRVLEKKNQIMRQFEELYEGH